MPFCRNCGHELDEEAKFCPECGTNQMVAKEPSSTSDAIADAEPIITEEPVIAPASGKLNVGMLVWSILNIVFCCLPLAIVSLVFTTNAKNAPNAIEEEKKIKVARICNIVNTSVIGGLALLYFLFMVFVGIMESL